MPRPICWCVDVPAKDCHSLSQRLWAGKYGLVQRAIAKELQERCCGRTWSRAGRGEDPFGARKTADAPGLTSIKEGEMGLPLYGPGGGRGNSRTGVRGATPAL